MSEDPLLRAGVALMALALAFAGAVALYAYLDEPPREAVAAKQTGPAAEPLKRGDPLQDAYVPEAGDEPEPAPEPEPKAPEPEPPPEPEEEPLPIQAEDWPEPSAEELASLERPRRYRLLPGAIMGLTMRSIGVINAPVFGSDSSRALDQGVAHVPETALPWERDPQKNVYLAGHRLGYYGTGSRLIFYELDELSPGDEVLLRDRQGRRYRYRVLTSFVADPWESWVMGEIRGRDLLTLQTCTGPGYTKRLIVRAERV
ncbi:MAG: sortase [Actinomycetota bacterium]